MASIGFLSAPSILSEIILDMKPTDLNAKAKIPGSAPKPTAPTNINAQIIS